MEPAGSSDPASNDPTAGGRQRTFGHLPWDRIEEIKERNARKDAYRESVRAKWRMDRTRRQRDLAVRVTAIERAVKQYETLDAGDREIRLRSSFVRLSEPRPPRDGERYSVANDLATRPLLTQLIHRPSNALPVLMTCYYIAHLEHDPGRGFENTRDNNFRGGWADLAGLRIGNDSREHNRRLGRALSKLAAAELVRIGPPGSSKRFHAFGLNREDGSGHPYTVPGETPRAERLVLPAGFFRAGWHLVLTNEELATFLAIAMHTQRLSRKPRSDNPEDAGIGLPRKVRWTTYGLAREAYTSYHELEEFGLITVYDPSNRRRGKRQPHLGFDEPQHDERAVRLIYTPDTIDFGKPAHEIVRDRLTASDVPPRLDRE